MKFMYHGCFFETVDIIWLWTMMSFYTLQMYFLLFKISHSILGEKLSLSERTHSQLVLENTFLLFPKIFFEDLNSWNV